MKLESIGAGLLTAFCLWWGSADRAHAQEASFPERGQTITLWVPYGAGGMVDMMGRTLAAYWDQKWGTRTVIQNRPGANGQLAFNEMFKSKRNGYTISFTQTFDTVMSYLDPVANAPYSRSDFEPVALVQRTPGVWVVKADSPYKTAGSLFDAAKARPDEISFGSPAARGVGVLHAKVLSERFGAKVNLVPFNDVPSAVNALIGGHVAVVTSNVAVAMPHVRSGRIRVLMVGGERPLKYFPEAPTSAAVGYHLYDFSHTGIAVAAGTPRGAVDAWAAMFREMAANEGLRARLDAMGVNLDYQGPQEYRKLWLEVEAAARDVLLQTAGSARTPR